MTTSITLNGLPIFHVVTDSFIGKDTAHYGITVTIDPQKLIDMIGDTYLTDNFRYSKEWGFVHAETGAIFTIYDYKETSFFNKDLPSPNSLWTKDSVSLYINHKSHDRDIAYLLADLLNQIAPPNKSFIGA